MGNRKWEVENRKCQPSALIGGGAQSLYELWESISYISCHVQCLSRTVSRERVADRPMRCTIWSQFCGGVGLCAAEFLHSQRRACAAQAQVGEKRWGKQCGRPSWSSIELSPTDWLWRSNGVEYHLPRARQEAPESHRVDTIGTDNEPPKYRPTSRERERETSLACNSLHRSRVCACARASKLTRPLSAYHLARACRLFCCGELEVAATRRRLRKRASARAAPTREQQQQQQRQDTRQRQGKTAGPARKCSGRSS